MPERIYVFLDNRFTGGGRNEALLAARDMSIKPKEESLRRNIVVFNSSSGIQSSFPIKEKSQGMFIYYLLWKFRETNGNVELWVLSEYIKEKVNFDPLFIYNKEENLRTQTILTKLKIGLSGS